MHTTVNVLADIAYEYIGRTLTREEYARAIGCRDKHTLKKYFDGLKAHDDEAEAEREWLRTAPRCKPKPKKGKHLWCSFIPHRKHRGFLPTWKKLAQRRPSR